MTLLTPSFPDTGLGALPDLDVELSLAPPTQGPIWRSIVSDARLASGLSVKRGRSRETDQFQTGTLDLELNNRDREFDPEHASSPIYEHIKPERRIRVLAKYADVQYVVFDGYVDGFEQSYPEWDSDAVASISAGDGFKVLAGCELPSSFYEMVVATDKPTHWWKLDEASGQSVLNDSGLTGANPAPGRIHDVTLGDTGFIGYDGSRTAASFAGNDIAWLGDQAAITKNTFTVAVAFSTSTMPGSGESYPFLHAYPDQGINAGNWVAITIVDAGATNVARGEISGTGVGFYRTTGTSEVVDGNQRFVVFTLSGGAVGTLYVNGTSEASRSDIASTIYGLPANLNLGQYRALIGENEFIGKMANVLIWDGVALSATQVADHYNAGANALSGEATGTRVRRILDYVGWPGLGLTTAAERDIDTGSSTVGAVDLSGGSALNYLQTLHDTEQGQFYMGLDGAMSSDSVFKVCWRQRHALLTSSRSSTSQATFGDDGSELKYADILVDYGENRLFNEGRVSRSGGAEQSYADPESQREYFKRPYEKSGLLYANDNDSFDHATWAVNRYSDPALRIIGLVIKPQRDPSNLWPQVLGREIGDRITVKRRPQGVGSAISKEAIIEGVEHSMSDGEWITVWRLSEADTTQYWVLDDSTLSVLDTTTVPAF